MVWLKTGNLFPEEAKPKRDFGSGISPTENRSTVVRRGWIKCYEMLRPSTSLPLFSSNLSRRPSILRILEGAFLGNLKSPRNSYRYWKLKILQWNAGSLPNHSKLEYWGYPTLLFFPRMMVVLVPKVMCPGWRVTLSTPADKPHLRTQSF